MQPSLRFHFAFACFLLIGTKASHAQEAARQELDYSTSTSGLVRLLDVEKDLINNLDEQAKFVENKIQAIRLTIKKLRGEHKAAEADPEAYFFNPLRGFSTIRRMESDWHKWQKAMKNPVPQAHINFMQSVKAKLPSDEDYFEALAGMYRIQTTYLLQARDIAAGRLNGRQHGVNMSALDCFAMGEHFNSKDEHESSLNWFGAALVNFNESKAKIYDMFGFNQAVIWQHVAQKFDDLDQPFDALDSIDMALEYAPEKQEYLDYRTDLKNSIMRVQLCGGEFVEHSKRLQCHYLSTTSAYLKIGPLKMEVLSLDPYIALYHDVIHDDEIKKIKELAKPLLKSSDGRNAEVASFEELEYVQERFDRRVAMLTGLSTDASEPVYAVNHGLGGDDYIHGPEQVPSVRPVAGNRFATVAFNLNDVLQGGETVFPALYLSVPTKKGTALVISLLDNAGERETRSLHAVCPVIAGSHWSLVKTVRDAPQMFIEPCIK